MEYVRYLLSFIYRIRWWLILGTTIITLAAYYFTRNMKGSYNVQATLYTGVVSGYSLEENSGRTDWAATQNAIDNLINIIKAESTLNRVSLRLFARVLINGNSEKESNYITPSSYNMTYNHVKNSPDGKHILSLIDKESEEKTLQNLLNYQNPHKDNYVYGLFYYNHPYYSYQALKRINVIRKGNSDLLDVAYSSGDPGIVYHTISILMEEFVNEYRSIRYGETDKVIEYFKSELNRIGHELRLKEDSLTNYNVEKRVINYYDETKEIASINKEFELREQSILFAYNSSKAMLEELEKRMTENERQAIQNVELIDKLKKVSALTGKITEMETLSIDNNSQKKDNQGTLQSYKNQLSQTEKELFGITNDYVTSQYTKNNVAKASIVEQWLEQTLQFEKARAELQIIQQSRQDLLDKYAFFAPVGSTIKRQERNIGFIEQNYLSLLKSYNDALLRKKNLEMTSATIKVLNPPAYPIGTESTNRRQIVMVACAGSFFAIFALLFLFELIDRTLRDPMRTKKIMGIAPLGVFPERSKKHQSTNEYCNEIAAKYLSNSILRFFTNREEGCPYIVNFLSTEKSVGKTYLIDHLEKYWTNMGLTVQRFNVSENNEINSSQFVLAKRISDICQYNHADILIVEYPDLHLCNIPTELLQEANLNLLILSATKGWKDSDKMLLNKLKMQIGKAPYRIYLNRVKRDVLESYTGMLPPYTLMRKLIYKFYQLALTEKVEYNSANSQKDADDD